MHPDAHAAPQLPAAADGLEPGRRRVALAIAAVVVVAVGLVVSRGHGLVADLAGGVLYTGLVYALAALVRPTALAWRVGLVALALSVAVELLQLTDLPRTLVGGVPFAGYVLGSTFVATDLLAYAAGALGAVVVDVVLGGPVSVTDRARPRG